MPTYLPAKRATALVFYLGLVDQTNPMLFKVNPTLAAGDFKVSIDGGALANLATLPAVTPAGSKMVMFSLSIAEMTGDRITVVCSDAAGNEWADVTVEIPTSARQIDDLATVSLLWSEALPGAYGAGSAGLKLNAAGGAADPWATPVPGAYAAGTAGKIIGTNLDAAISSRSTLGGTAQTGDAFLRLGAPAGASVSADVAAVKGVLPAALVGGRIDASVGSIVAGQLVFKRNAAFPAFMFLLVDGTDFVTPRTGVAVTAQRSLDGSVFAACANAVTEIGSGWYKIDLAAGDLNATNIAMKFSGTGAATRNIQIFTQP